MELLSYIFKNNKSDSIVLRKEFKSTIFVGPQYFNSENIKEQWQFLLHPNINPIKPFLDNFDLLHIREELSNKEDTGPEIYRLLEKPTVFMKKVELDSIENERKNGKIKMLSQESHINFEVIGATQPIYNCAKTWAVVIMDSYNPYLNIYNGQTMNIYRKTHGKWQLYHKFSISTP